MGYYFRLPARVLLYVPSHRQEYTYHSLCDTSRGALAGTRNSSMGPPHEGSIRWPIAPWANALVRIRLRCSSLVECSLIVGHQISFSWLTNSANGGLTVCLRSYIAGSILFSEHIVAIYHFMVCHCYMPVIKCNVKCSRSRSFHTISYICPC